MKITWSMLKEALAYTFVPQLVLLAWYWLSRAVFGRWQDGLATVYSAATLISFIVTTCFCVFLYVDLQDDYERDQRSERAHARFMQRKKDELEALDG